MTDDLPYDVETCDGCGRRLRSHCSKDVGVCYNCLNDDEDTVVEQDSDEDTDDEDDDSPTPVTSRYGAGTLQNRLNTSSGTD